MQGPLFVATDNHLHSPAERWELWICLVIDLGLSQHAEVIPNLIFLSF